ncbi:MAG TPA: MBL fold metallo-hydrolase, partial [Chroococcales cyanobacterium]
MKQAVAIAEGVHWVGAIDWDVRNFHGYHFSTHRGTTYNAYLVVGQKIALVDTVHAPFAKEMIERIESVVPLEKIDFVVSNHVEMDHSGAMPELMSRIPRAKVFCTQKGKEGLFRYYGEEWDFNVVKTGDILHLGKKSLQFIEAPMLHWPDSMFTYHPEESLLLSNDAFGQHLATS